MQDRKNDWLGNAQHQKNNKFTDTTLMQNKSLHLNKGQYICSAPSTGRHQNYRENKTLIKIINIIYSSLLG